ncbi:MAG TPA: homocysteine S-methyltransferase family protein [Anaeromyxobacter sp.]
MLDRPTLLDGAMGTALLARGLPARTPPEAWLRERPEEIARVHAEHAAAGARVLLSCTFGCASPRVEAAVGAAAVPSLCATAVRLARAAASPSGARVAGAVGPTGLVPAGGSVAPAPLELRYGVPLGALAEAGADLLWIESQWDLGEARAALAAARRTGLPAVVTFTFEDAGGRLRAPHGPDAGDCLAAMAEEGAIAVGVNCVSPGDALAALAAWAAERLAVPFVAKPSPGLPGAVATPAAFAAALRPAIAAGLRVVGGCCGATADHLRALAPLVSGG